VTRTDGVPAASLAVRRRRESRRQEWEEQTLLAELLLRYLDPKTTFWSSLENRPRSLVGGIFQRRRGVKSGLPDVLVVAHGQAVFVELKSRRGVATPAQKERAAELVAAGAAWFLARSARATLAALNRSGVVFRRQWTPPRLEPWEGPWPFPDASRPLPQHPQVAGERQEARRRSRERKRAQKLAAQAAAELDGDAGPARATA
jgi:hypothetical protein